MYRIIFKHTHEDFYRYLMSNSISGWSYTSDKRNASIFDNIKVAKEVAKKADDRVSWNSTIKIQECVQLQHIDTWIDYKILTEINELDLL